MDNDTPFDLDSAFDSALDEIGDLPDEDDTTPDPSEEESGSDTVLEQKNTDDEEDLSDIPDEDIEEPADAKPKEDAFTKVNPDELPDELKSVYKSLQADYTRKRQEDRDAANQLKKEVDDLRELLNSRQDPRQPRPDETPEDAYRRIARETFIAEQEQMFDKTAQTEYPNINRRLDEDSGHYDPMLDTWLRSQLTDELQTHIDKTGSKIGFDYKSIANDKIKAWDEYMLNSKKAYLQRQRELAKKQVQEHKKKQAPSSPKVKTSDVAPRDIGGAIEAAFDEIV